MKAQEKNHEMQVVKSENAPAAKKTRKPRAKYITIAERFKDVPDVVWDENCQAYLAGRLASITKNREKTNNELSAEARRLKRNEYDNLVERGLWDAKQMSDEFLVIAQKKSNLPGVLRNYIETLLIEAMNHTLEHYREIEKQRETKKAKRNEKAE